MRQGLQEHWVRVPRCLGVDAASLPHPATAVATIATAAALPAATTLAVALAVLTRAASAGRL